MQIDYLDISLFGLWLTKSRGELSYPKPKERLNQNWHDSHGLDIDLSQPYLETRNIELELTMVVTGTADYINKMQLLQQHLQQPGLRVLKFDDIPKPYFVYLSDVVEPDRLTPYTSGRMAAKLTLKFIEPNPVALNFSATQGSDQTVSVTLSSPTPITINWGDGTFDIVKGTNITKTHNYNANILSEVTLCDNSTPWGTNVVSVSETWQSGSNAIEVTTNQTTLFLNMYNIKYNKFYLLGFFGRNLTPLHKQRFNWQYNYAPAELQMQTTILEQYKKKVMYDPRNQNYTLIASPIAGGGFRFTGASLIEISKAEYSLLTEQQAKDRYVYGINYHGANYNRYIQLAGNITDITKLTVTNLTEI